MSKAVEVECENCYYPFPQYATVCPACKEPRWDRWYWFVRPDPKTGEFRDENKDKLASAGLSMITCDNSLDVIPKGDDRVLLIRWGKNSKITKPLGDTLVKPIGYYWMHTTKEGWDIPDEDFPPKDGRSTQAIPPANEERDRYIYEERKKGREFKLIISTVNKHPSWEHFDADSSDARIDAARKAMVRYCRRHVLDVPSRDDTRTRRTRRGQAV